MFHTEGLLKIGHLHSYNGSAIACFFFFLEMIKMSQNYPEKKLLSGATISMQL